MLSFAALIIAAAIGHADTALQPRDAVMPWNQPASAQRCAALAELVNADLLAPETIDDPAAPCWRMVGEVVG